MLRKIFQILSIITGIKFILDVRHWQGLGKHEDFEHDIIAATQTFVQNYGTDLRNFFSIINVQDEAKKNGRDIIKSLSGAYNLLALFLVNMSSNIKDQNNYYILFKFLILYYILYYIISFYHMLLDNVITNVSFPGFDNIRINMARKIQMKRTDHAKYNMLCYCGSYLLFLLTYYYFLTL